jgi:hypothetical protein
MADETRPGYVTRAELYPTLGSLYLLIAIAFLALVRLEGESTLRVVGYFLFFAVALGMSVTFNILAIRDRRRTRSGPGPAGPGAAPARGDHTD